MNCDANALARIIEGGSVPYRQNAIAFIFECPRCSKKDKLYIRKRDGRFVCWVCKETDNFQGRPEYALKELYNLNVRDLQKALYGDVDPNLLDTGLYIELEDFYGDMVDENTILVDPLPKELCWPPDFVTFDDGEPFLKAAKYLHSRGMNIDHVRTYDIRYHPSEKRVIFPVKVDDRLIGWQGRYIDNTKVVYEDGREYNIPKIVTSDSLRDTGQRYLMFQDRLRGSEHCVLTEGPVSAIKAHLCGGNVASMGKAVTQRQLETILSYNIKKLYLALDPDAASEVMRILQLLDDRVETYLLLPPEGCEDLGDATQEAVLEQFKRAPPLPRSALVLSLDGNFYC